MTETLPLDAIKWDPSIYYSCVTDDPLRLWTVRPDTKHGFGWIGRLADTASMTASETGWGFKLEAVSVLFTGWGLPAGTAWSPKAAQSKVEMVYLIGPAAGGLVKIGRSVDVAQRLASIQRMSPVPLRVLWQTPGGHALEHRLHRRFADLRSHGEWFDFADLDPVDLVSKEAR